jgi:hypothetical protein
MFRTGTESILESAEEEFLLRVASSLIVITFSLLSYSQYAADLSFLLPREFFLSSVLRNLIPFSPVTLRTQALLPDIMENGKMEKVT